MSEISLKLAVEGANETSKPRDFYSEKFLKKKPSPDKAKFHILPSSYLEVPFNYKKFKPAMESFLLLQYPIYTNVKKTPFTICLRL